VEDDQTLERRSFRDIHQSSLSGKDLGRILALSDGVFAFAITLLVLQLVIPVCTAGTNCNEAWIAGRLNGEYTIFLAYVFTFFIIGTWWVRHHSAFRYVERYDSTLIWLNLLFLLMIAVQPFILGLFAAYSSLEASVVLFGAIQTLAGLLILVLWMHAARAHLLSREADAQVVRYYELRGAVLTLIFLSSAVVALVSLVGAEVLWTLALVLSAYLRRI
jgi:uncharacterized membrane protein